METGHIISLSEVCFEVTLVCDGVENEMVTFHLSFSISWDQRTRVMLDWVAATRRSLNPATNPASTVDKWVKLFEMWRLKEAKALEQDIDDFRKLILMPQSFQAYVCP